MSHAVADAEDSAYFLKLDLRTYVFKLLLKNI